MSDSFHPPQCRAPFNTTEQDGVQKLSTRAWDWDFTFHCSKCDRIVDLQGSGDFKFPLEDDACLLVLCMHSATLGHTANDHRTTGVCKNTTALVGYNHQRLVKGEYSAKRTNPADSGEARSQPSGSEDG